MSPARRIRLAAGMILLAAPPASLHAQTILADQAGLQTLGQVAFTEGPLWHPDGSVLFSECPSSSHVNRALP